MVMYSTFWGLATGSYSLQNNRPSSNRKMTHMHRSQNQRVNKALLLGLLGATSGSNVTDTRNRIQAIQTIGSIDNRGGKRVIETVSLINRNTTAADVTAMKALIGNQFSWPNGLGPSTSPASNDGYPVDKSGNGSGTTSKLGF